MAQRPADRPERHPTGGRDDSADPVDASSPGDHSEPVPEGAGIEYVGRAQPMDPARRRSRPGDGAKPAPPDAAERPPSPPPSRPPTTERPPRAERPPGRPGARRHRPPSVIGAVDRVRKAEFPVVLRGYDRAAVDSYVAEVAQLVAELEATQLPDAVVQRALDEVGDETSEILKRAHETAEEVTSRTQSEAAARLERAEREAELIRRDAEEQASTLDDDIGAMWQERQRLIDDLRQLAEEVLAVADDALDRAPPPAVRDAQEDEDTAAVEIDPDGEVVDEAGADLETEDEAGVEVPTTADRAGAGEPPRADTTDEAPTPEHPPDDDRASERPSERAAGA